MSVVVGADGIIRVNGVPCVFPHDATGKAAPILGGFNGDAIQLSTFTPDGRLKVDAAVSIDTVTQTSNMQAADSAGTPRALGSTRNPDALTWALYTQDQRMTFTGGALDVSLAPNGLALDATLTSGAVLAGLVSIGVSTVLYGEQLAVAASASANLVTYTVPVGKSFYLKHIGASGDNAGLFTVSINGSAVAKRRSSLSEFNVDFDFESDPNSGVKLVAGDALTLDVTNRGSSAGDFNASIYGRLA